MSETLAEAKRSKWFNEYIKESNNIKDKIHEMVNDANLAVEMEEEAAQEVDKSYYGKVMRAVTRADTASDEEDEHRRVKEQKAAEWRKAREALATATEAVKDEEAKEALEGVAGAPGAPSARRVAAAARAEATAAEAAAERAYNVAEMLRAAFHRINFERVNEVDIAKREWRKYAEQNPDQSKEEKKKWQIANPSTLYEISGGRRYKSKRHNRTSKRHNRTSKRHNRTSKRHNRTSKRHNRISKRHNRISKRHNRTSKRHNIISKRHNRTSKRHK